MHITRTLSLAFLAAIPATAKYVFRDEQAHTLFPRQEVNTTAANTTCDWTEPRLTIAEAMANFMALWAGNHSEWLVNHTFVPDVQLHTDRLPSGTNDNATTVPLEVMNTTQILQYMNMSGVGFTQYDFVSHVRFANAEKTMYMIRWGLEAIVGADNPSE